MIDYRGTATINNMTTDELLSEAEAQMAVIGTLNDPTARALLTLCATTNQWQSEAEQACADRDEADEARIEAEDKLDGALNRLNTAGDFFKVAQQLVNSVEPATRYLVGGAKPEGFSLVVVKTAALAESRAQLAELTGLIENAATDDEERKL